jgi:hypothetical protein
MTRAGNGKDLSTIVQDTGDATNGHVLANDGRVFVDFHNTNAVATARTATLFTTSAPDGLTPPTKVITVPAGKTYRAGPWPTSFYGSSVHIDVSHAEMKLEAWRQPTS